MTELHPLRLSALRLSQYRNIERLELEPGPRFNVFYGDNGAGKSNLLEAVYYLAALKSFRGAKAADLVRRGEERALIEGRVEKPPLPSTYRAQLSRTAPRVLSLDGQRPRSIATWISSVQVVMFHPGDNDLMTGPPEGRRAFIDRVIEQMDATYAAALREYQRALRSRNQLLKVEEGRDVRAIRAYDEILAAAGSVIGLTREQVLADLTARAIETFARVNAEGAKLEVHYEPRCEPTVEALRRAYEQSIEKDLLRGFTAEGPHADEIAFSFEGSPARHRASQGQQRAIVLAFKLAELDLLAERTNAVPILLLDDVSSELDRTRNEHLFEQIAKIGGQAFLTTTHPEYIQLQTDRVDFAVQNGVVRRV